MTAGGAQAGALRLRPQQLIQQAVVTPSDPMGGDEFGWSVAMTATGNVAVIGAPAKGQLFSGRVFVMTRAADHWNTMAELVPDLPPGGNAFGHAVAVSADGTTVLVSSDELNGGAGAAFVFHRTDAAWKQVAELEAGDAAPLDRFGQSLALSADGRTALIGAYAKDGAVGAAYVFQWTPAGWLQRQELLASDGAAGDTFGGSVAMSADGDTLLVGASGRAVEAGAACVFRRGDSGWSESAILTASDGGSYDRFGAGVALSADGRTALVSNLKPFVFPYHPPASYVFTGSGSTWNQQAELTGAGASAVALSSFGNVALVGDFFSVRNGSQWSQPAPIATTSQNGSYLGYSVSLDAFGDRGIIGAPFEPGTTGAAYIVGSPPAPWPPPSSSP